MSILSILGKIASAIFSKSVVDTLSDSVKGWWDARQQRKLIELEHKTAIKKAEVEAQIERIRTDQQLYADADQQAIAAWKHSYVDEVLVGTVVILVLSCFIPELQLHVREGVSILNEFPFWLQIIIGGTYISILGIRFVFLAPLGKVFRK